MGATCFAEEEQKLFVLDRKTDTLYQAKYDEEKKMYLPVEAKEGDVPTCDNVKGDTVDDETINAKGQLRVPALDEGKYIATYAEDAIIETNNFQDIFQVYVCGLYKSCDHINGTLTGFDRSVDAYWEGKNVVFRAKVEMKNGKKDGVSEVYYDNGYIAESCTFQNGSENGPIIQYYPDGKFKWKGNYKDGKLDGLDQTFDENGVLRIETHYADGVHNGEIKMYDEEGHLVVQGKLKHKPVVGHDGYDEIYDGVVYDEEGKEVKKIEQGSILRIGYDDLNLEKLQLKE